jgi:hypothetical protein
LYIKIGPIFAVVNTGKGVLSLCSYSALCIVEVIRSLEESPGGPETRRLVNPDQRLRSQLITKYDFQVRREAVFRIRIRIH